MSQLWAYAPIQAAEFSGPGKHAIALYTPEWSEIVLTVLRQQPEAYEAAWHFQPEQKSHMLEVQYENGPAIHIAFIDGVHNQIFARLAQGAALVLSPFPLYRETPDSVDEKLFDPAESLALPNLPNPLG